MRSFKADVIRWMTQNDRILASIMLTYTQQSSCAAGMVQMHSSTNHWPHGQSISQWTHCTYESGDNRMMWPNERSMIYILNDLLLNNLRACSCLSILFSLCSSLTFASLINRYIGQCCINMFSTSAPGGLLTGRAFSLHTHGYTSWQALC
jgi:hypothetical protein